MFDLDQTLTALLGAAGGGGAFRLWQALSDHKLRKAQAEQIGVKTTPEVTELTVSSLVMVNENLTKDYERVLRDNERIGEERDYYRDRLNAALTQLDEVQADLKRAQVITSRLQDQIHELLDMEELNGDDGP